METEKTNTNDLDINNLGLITEIKNIITGGGEGHGLLPNDADLAVCINLLQAGTADSVITTIFDNYPIGVNYRNSKDSEYLKRTIASGREKIHLTKEELMNPLYLRDVITYKDEEKELNIVKFQEFLADYTYLIFVENGLCPVRYNGKCYDYLTNFELNNSCQRVLAKDRYLFKQAKVKEIYHFGIGGKIYGTEKTVEDQINYLSLGNGLYDLKRQVLITHDPEIFTSNLLPYSYNPEAKCHRWVQFLDEVCCGNQEMIDCLQEAVGYIFHMSIPKPALFFLVGSGANGKSVFLNTIGELVGKKNRCSVSLNFLGKEYYLWELQNKMLNISTETPRNRSVNMDQVKAICSGDMVVGRKIYGSPGQFKPFAKHFLAMNELPLIDDMTFGMQRRLYIFPFERTFAESEMDVDLEDKLRAELPGIFIWALAGLMRLKKNNFVFTKVGTMGQTMEKFKTVNNSDFDFIEHAFEKADNNSRISFKSAYIQYEAYCEQHAYSPKVKKLFRVALERSGYRVKNSTLDQNAVYVFGIKAK